MLQKEEEKGQRVIQALAPKTKGLPGSRSERVLLGCEIMPIFPSFQRPHAITYNRTRSQTAFKYFFENSYAVKEYILASFSLMLS